jgi:hypothetical protein
MIKAPSNVRIKASSEIDNKEDIPGDFEKKLSDPAAYAIWVKGINENMLDTNRRSRRLTMVPIHQKRLSIKLFL